MRDLLTGTAHFNDLERGLPGISRGLLAARLRLLQQMELVEKIERGSGRRRTEYRLTEAGRAVSSVIDAMLHWGAQWAFEAPSPDDLDPILLLWWMRNGVRAERLPEQRVVAQFDFRGACSVTYWLLLTRDDTSLCLSHPGFDIDVLVTADLASLFEVWLGRRYMAEALHEGRVIIDAVPALAQAFPDWFSYSLAAPAVRAAREQRAFAGSAP